MAPFSDSVAIKPNLYSKTLSGSTVKTALAMLLAAALLVTGVGTARAATTDLAAKSQSTASVHLTAPEVWQQSAFTARVGHAVVTTQPESLCTVAVVSSLLTLGAILVGALAISGAPVEMAGIVVSAQTLRILSTALSLGAGLYGLVQKYVC